jgi:hypothetical protein
MFLLVADSYTIAPPNKNTYIVEFITDDWHTTNCMAPPITTENNNIETPAAQEIMIRVSPDIYERVVDLIRQGKHTTKADVAKTALIEYLTKQDIREQTDEEKRIQKEEIHTALIELIDDPEVGDKLKKIMKDLLASVKF